MGTDSDKNRRGAEIVGAIRRLFGSSKGGKPRPKSEVELLRARLKTRHLLKVPPRQTLPLSEVFRRGVYHFLASSVRAARSKDIKTSANIFFGNVMKLSPEYFKPLREAIINSDMEVIPESYVGIMTALSFSVALVAAVLVLFEATVFDVSIWLVLLGVAVLPAIAFFVAFILAYIYPFHMVNAKRQSIDTNLPFAINHMAAIASSGVPPEKAFEMMAEFKEYGAVSKESANLVRQINALGKDTLTAIRTTAANTPSKSMKELLYGVLAVIETGGNLKEYLNEMAQIALFNYQLERKKYIETLSTYADIYTAILIAAPLFLVSILAVMNIIPGSLVGSLSIEDFMKLGVYVLIPAMNIGFLLFISYTQPEM